MKAACGFFALRSERYAARETVCCVRQDVSRRCHHCERPDLRVFHIIIIVIIIIVTNTIVINLISVINVLRINHHQNFPQPGSEAFFYFMINNCDCYHTFLPKHVSLTCGMTGRCSTRRGNVFQWPAFSTRQKWILFLICSYRGRTQQ